jgi:hypothetical protein
MPATATPGVVRMQFAVLDPQGPKGVAVSNALRMDIGY